MYIGTSRISAGTSDCGWFEEPLDVHFVHDLLGHASQSLLGDPAGVIGEGHILCHGLFEHLLCAEVAVGSRNGVGELNGECNRVEESEA